MKSVAKKALVASSPVSGILPVLHDIADLYLSPLNPRQEAPEDGIALLAQSIIACGLIQNLSGVMDAEGKIAIVAGGRRLRALQIAAAERPELAQVPVLVAPDEPTAIAWANAENAAREGLNVVDEVRGYRSMAQTGATVVQIALAFGQNELTVRRRLKLAALPDDALDALKAGKISLGAAQALTLAKDAGTVTDLLAQIEASPLSWSEHSIRARLRAEGIPASSSKAKFVTLEAYEAAGGTVTTDLFGGGATLDDAALLEKLFTEGVDREAVGFMAEGFQWAEFTEDAFNPPSGWATLRKERPELSEADDDALNALYDREEEDGELSEADAARKEELEAMMEPVWTADQKAVGGVLFYLNAHGEAKIAGVYVKPEAMEQARENGLICAGQVGGGQGATEDKAKPVMSAKLVEDLRAIRVAAVQTALMRNPGLVLDLLSFGMSTASGAGGAVLGLNPEKPMNTPSIPDGFERPAALDHKPSSSEAWNKPEWRVEDICAAFTSYRDRSEDERMADLIAGLARTVSTSAGSWATGGSMFGLMRELTGAKEREVWTPTADSFFKRVPGHYLESLFFDLTGTTGEGIGEKAFAKMTKGEKAATLERLFTDREFQAALGLSEAQIATIDAWVPEDK